MTTTTEATAGLCFTCWYLARENRVERGRLAIMVVAGHSVCEMHGYLAMMHGDNPLVMLDLARKELVEWWQIKELAHGYWSTREQKFADGTTLDDAGYPWKTAKA